MAFIINPVTNIQGTPGVISGNFEDIPATGSQDGTIYFARNTQQIFQYDVPTTTWVLMGSGTGGGATPPWQDVMAEGNTTTNDAILLGSRYVLRNLATGFNISILGDETDSYVSDNLYTLPDKAGVPDTFAMLSDIAASVGNLQQVTDNGNVTTNSILIDDGSGDIGFEIAPNGSAYLKTLGNPPTFRTQIRPTSPKTEDFALPNKGGVPDTFAMLSDIAAGFGTLQQVTTLGNTTDQGMNITDNSFDVRDTGTNQHVIIDPDAITISSPDGSKDTIISQPSNGSSNDYRLPDKAGVVDTFAMLSDLVQSGAYSPTGQNLVNIATVAQVVRLQCNWIRFSNVFGFIYQVDTVFLVTPTAAGLTSYDVGVVGTTTVNTTNSYRGQVTAVDVATGLNVICGYIPAQGATNALCRIVFIATAAVQYRLNIRFTYIA